MNPSSFKTIRSFKSTVKYLNESGDSAEYNTMKKKQSSVGCLFWIALVLLVLVVFLFNKKTIQTVIEKTGFMNVLKKERPEEPAPPEVTITVTDSDRKDTAEEPVKVTKEKEPLKVKPQQPEKQADEIKPSATRDKPAEEPEKPDETETRVRNSKLYFIVTDETGEIELTSVVRPVNYRDTPLSETIRALTRGLTSSELNKGYISLIPVKTVLRSATVKDGIAFLDFSEQFSFNSFGYEGYIAQLKQVVYTATEFAGVKLVQILIEGQKRQYLAPEGIFIGAPLSRESF